jgi:hypothetical protein
MEDTKMSNVMLHVRVFDRARLFTTSSDKTVWTNYQIRACGCIFYITPRTIRVHYVELKHVFYCGSFFTGNGIHLSSSNYDGHPSLDVLVQQMRSQVNGHSFQYFMFRFFCQSINLLWLVPKIIQILHKISHVESYVCVRDSNDERSFNRLK